MKKIIAALCAVWISISTVCATSVEVRSARALYAQKDYAGALENLKKAIKKDSKDVEALFMLSVLYYQMNDFDNAFKNIDKAIKYGKKDPNLPIYHGTEEGTLSAGIGHLEWSSLPVGGVGSHCVLSGHSGLPSAKLFSDLRFMSMGDQFSLCVLNETLTYEVDQILVVEPEDVKDLLLVPGEDYCTLVTCTPYGVNSHRLLVRGKRIEDTEAVGAGHVTNEAIRLATLLAALLVAIPLLMFLLLVTVLHDKNRMQKAAKHGGKSS